MHVNATISPSETMMDGDIQRYLSVGDNALASIQLAIGHKQPRSILDLPCGHGRVARFLKAAYPDAKLYVSDLDEAGMAFCAQTFGAVPLRSTPRFEDISFDIRFDLIWVGSLVTHLSAERTTAFLGFLHRHLTPDGHAVVTSHGAFVAGRLGIREKPLYGIGALELRGMFKDYIALGYGYRDYPKQSGYGISVMSREWVEQAANATGLRVLSHKDHGWDNHHDVICFAHGLTNGKSHSSVLDIGSGNLSGARID